MPTIFAVIGERRDDPLEWLLLGANGQHYAYRLLDGRTTPVVPDASWTRDRHAPTLDDLR
jgi:hypothetical protein